MFRFIAWSDSSGNAPGFYEISILSPMINDLNPAFTCYPGDLSAGSSYGSDITGVWKIALNSGGDLWDKTFVGRGNHDCSTDNVCTSADDTTWQNIFNFGPESDTNSIAYKVGATNYNALTTDLNYSFDYQNSHFVFLDCSTAEVNTLTANQITWLNNDIISTETRTNLQHTFLFWHGPMYDNGMVHCCNCSTYIGCPAPPSSLISVFNNHPIISATFHGHEHMVNYTHITSNEIPGLSRSFEQFISGGAGAYLYNINLYKKCDYYLGSSPTSLYYGILVIDVNGTNYTVTSYRDNGTPHVIGTFTNNYNSGCLNPTCYFQLT